MPRTTPSNSHRWRGSSSGPKKSGSISASGRAPMVKMSRRMPPTPVAAPWWGSMAEGWLWLSMRMATAMPSPASITPAFSPGPTRTPGPSVGSRPRCTREDLYEQCSLHITAYRASSSRLGSRPSTRRDLGELVVGQPERAVEGLVVALRAGHGPTLPVGGSTAVRARRPLVCLRQHRDGPVFEEFRTVDPDRATVPWASCRLLWA